jgi:hypothetical protein
MRVPWASRSGRALVDTNGYLVEMPAIARLRKRRLRCLQLRYRRFSLRDHSRRRRQLGIQRARKGAAIAINELAPKGEVPRV